VVDVSLPPLNRPLRLRVPRALVVLFAVILLAMNWTTVQSASRALSEAARGCDTRIGVVYDRVQNRLFKTPLQCGCDGRLDLSTGCALPVLP
jgi:hypothetical protein